MESDECCRVEGEGVRRSFRRRLDVEFGVVFLKINKGEDAEVRKSEMGKFVVIKEREGFREGDRESARRREVGRRI